MAQSPLAPPPGTGDPILGRWLFLLWKRLTATGQILWSSIVPGTSADVAAVVTDETGTAGSLVFSGNPTLNGCYIDGIFYQGSTVSVAGQTILSGIFSTDTASGTVLSIRKSCTAISGPNFIFAKSRGTASSPTVVAVGDVIGVISCSGYDGSGYIQGVQILGYVDDTPATGVIPSRLIINTLNSSGAWGEALRITKDQAITLGGAPTATALKVTPVASQARWVEVTGATSSGNPTIGTSGGDLATAPATGFLRNTAATTSIIYSTGTTGSGTFVAQGAAGQAAAYQMLIDGAETARVVSTSNGMGLSTGPSAAVQVGIAHTASANRYITLTGSNGGNPKIGTNAGQLTLGTGAALATSATEGYVCIPTCAGAPTGVPAGAGAGNLPLIYDTTNNKLYAYNGAWKATAALT